jgi:formate dehydrogenase major subunit
MSLWFDQNGELRPATWDEARSRANGFRKNQLKHGPAEFGIFSCSKTTNELNFLAQKFADRYWQQQYR